MKCIYIEGKYKEEKKMKKLNKYQKTYMWNRKRATKKNTYDHMIMVCVAENQEELQLRQIFLSSKHSFWDYMPIDKDNKIVVTAENCIENAKALLSGL